MDLTFFGLLPMIFGSAPADTPRSLLDSIYQPLQSSQPINLEEHYSDRLQQLVANNLEINAVDPERKPIDPSAAGIVAFDPFLNGSPHKVDALAVSEPVVQGDVAVALVSFETDGIPSILSISMINQTGWKIDDVASVGPGEKWLYSWLLQYDPFGQQ